MSYVDKIFDKNYLEYASYVIKDRAIPDIRDGLKPVQRRILHSLFEMDDGKFHKVANVVGHCMKYHPHGDASIYEALVQLAQKELLIDTQGNFGNVMTGDVASAARYIECRITPFAREILYNKNITEYTESYDGRNQEPVFFPAKIPLVLILGVDGIAVGMSTSILPHNLREVLLAVQDVLRGKVPQLYPDFVQGGLLDVSDYQDGLGKVRVRARLDTSDPKRIVVRELPYGITTEKLMNSIEAAASKGKIKIAEINDYTAENVEIEIKLPKGIYAKDVEDSFYAFTHCEVSYSVNLLVIKDKKPKIMTVSEVLAYHAQQLVSVLKQELEYEERELKDLLHARTLEQIFIEERIYKRIEEMKTSVEVTNAVISGFEPFKAQIKRTVTPDDVERLLKIPIRRISLYDMNKLRKEIEEIKGRLKEIKGHLANLTAYALSWLDGILKKNEGRFIRRTTLTSFEKITLQKVALRDKKLRYDPNSGHLGLGLSSGNVVCEVSDVDKILLIDKDAVWRVIKVPQRLYVGKDLLYIGLADKEQLASIVFSLAYKRQADKMAYLKRFVIEGWILDKTYSLLPDGASPLAFTTRQDLYVKLDFKQRSLIQSKSDLIPLSDFLIKNPSAQGRRLSTKEVIAVRFVNKDGSKPKVPDEG